MGFSCVRCQQARRRYCMGSWLHGGALKRAWRVICICCRIRQPERHIDVCQQWRIWARTINHHTCVTYLWPPKPSWPRGSPAYR